MQVAKETKDPLLPLEAPSPALALAAENAANLRIRILRVLKPLAAATFVAILLASLATIPFHKGCNKSHRYEHDHHANSATRQAHISISPEGAMSIPPQSITVHFDPTPASTLDAVALQLVYWQKDHGKKKEMHVCRPESLDFDAGVAVFGKECLDFEDVYAGMEVGDVAKWKVVVVAPRRDGMKKGWMKAGMKRDGDDHEGDEDHHDGDHHHHHHHHDEDHEHKKHRYGNKHHEKHMKHHNHHHDDDSHSDKDHDHHHKHHHDHHDHDDNMKASFRKQFPRKDFVRSWSKIKLIKME
ncbi:hypothetical protein HDU98_002961 [Podochytrium sp. JEL0797]|nr:hypothetical protein HDU98_002961 [Podochytrium sp. JEL0797]